MSDSHDTKKTSIPSWQRGDVSYEPATPSSTVRDPTSPLPQEDPQQDSQRHLHASRASLLNLASKFLEDGDIRDAPLERKRAFLESKGLSSLEIEELLAVSPSEENSSGESKKQSVKDLEVSGSIPDRTHSLSPAYRPVPHNRHKMTVI